MYGPPGSHGRKKTRRKVDACLNAPGDDNLRDIYAHVFLERWEVPGLCKSWMSSQTCTTFFVIFQISHWSILEVFY